MKKHTLATLAFAALAAFSAITKAEAVDGDIYAITNVNNSSGLTGYLPGETVQFRVRLLSRSWTNKTEAAAWRMVHTGPNSEAWDAERNPLKLGIVVSGQLREARIANIVVGNVEEKPDAHPYTDLICEYDVRPGDIALPLRLAVKSTKSGSGGWEPAGASASGTEYYLFNEKIWQLQDDEGKPARFFFCSDDARTKAPSPHYWGDNSDLGEPGSDYSLAKANCRIKAVDFDANKDSSTYWRIVKEGTTETTYLPTIETIGRAPEAQESVTLYIWSDDETAVEMAGNQQPREITLEDGTKTTKKVATVQIVTGETTYPIEIRGITKGRATKLILSPTLGFQFDVAGTKLENYLTADVYCSEPPSPNLQLCFDPAYPTSSKTKTVETSTNTTENLAKDAVPLYLELSEAYSNDLAILIAITNVGKVACDPITNRNISVSQYGDSFSETDIAYTNLTIKAGEKEAIIYVYPLGGDALTQAQGISFTPVITNPVAKAHYEIGQRALLKIKSAHRPVVSSSMAGTDDPQDANGFMVPVMVQDCYRDLKHPLGFKVDVDFSDGTKMATTNIVFTENVETPITLSGYNVNAKYANIKVTEPDGSASGTIRINFTVKPQKTITAALYDSTEEGSLHVGTVFNEGAAPLIRFSLSEKLAVGNDRYAFLVPQNAASSNLVDCLAFKQGVLISGGLTNSQLSAQWALKLKDGCAASDGTEGALRYKIVLRTENTLTTGEADTTYTDVAGVQFTVANLLPELKGVYVNGNPTSVKDGEHYKNPLSSDINVDFGFKNADASSVDVERGLITIWCFTEGRTSTSWKYKAVVTNATTAILQHKFTYPGVTQQVQVVTIDKDILHSLTNGTGLIDFTKESDLKTLWPRLSDYVTPFSFTVAISTKPHIVVEPYGFVTTDYGETMDETGNSKTAKLRVTLSEQADHDLTVRLIAKPAFDPDADNAVLEFATATKPVDIDDKSKGVYTELTIKQDQFEPGKSASYILSQGLKFDYASLNGTAGSENDGWEIIAEVGEWVGGVWTPDETTYAKSEGTMITVLNLAPTVSPKQPDTPSTNKTVTLGKPFELKWTPGDVKADMQAEWPGSTALQPMVGLKCEWYVNDAYQAGKTVYVKNLTGKTVGAEQTTSITLNDEGLSIVKLVISDIDGEDYHGVTERTWLYYISPSKKLSVTPVGPAGSSKTRYLGKAGLGKGRVWADGGTVLLAAFNQTWAYNIKTDDAKVFAYGYPGTETSYPDDGTLGPGARDVAIDPYGEAVETGLTADKYYNYASPYDNFFYRWAYIVTDDNGGAPSIEYGIVQPAAATNAVTLEAVALEKYEANKESYPPRQLEAVFSRELLLSDNLGDINGDGVPDIYLRNYLDLGICDEFGTVVGNDLQNLSQTNPDADYLPNTMTAKYAAFIPGLSNTWVTVGRAFTTLQEIRGAGDALNDAPMLAGVAGSPDRIYTNPNDDPNSTLEYIEYIAFTNWCARQEMPLDPTDAASWQLWSPERPTDPTLADTDGDGLPDGYEYYFWYKAHVGSLVTTDTADGKLVTNLVRMTGRRYNPYNPNVPGTISADEIEKLFDPLARTAWDDATDTDNDGLPDMIEFMIGTNPVDYDTDGDMLPDGYEVLISKTDPLKTGEGDSLDPNRNDDGDAMAISSIMVIPLQVAYTNAVPGDLAKSLLQTNTLYAMVADASRLTNLVEVTGGAFGEDKYKNLVDGAVLYNGWNYNGTTLGRAVETVESSKNLVIYSIGNTNAITIVHYQVYGAAGFDPRTGWQPSNNRPNTAAYTIYDEFMSLAFFYQTGGLTEQDLVPTDAHPWSWIWANYSTNPNNADSDNDNVPDGWEFYTMGGPKVLSGLSPTHPLSPLFDFHREEEFRDADKDGLDHEAEWCGTTCCEAYPTLTNCQPDWTNKAMPTDPWNADTDGDGISDSGEKVCLEAGGLNPLTWDTDGDGLPDPWELQYVGTWSTGGTTTSVTTGSDGTVTTNSTTAAFTFNNDGMNPTVNDAMLDYDNDGLNNWQEYMVAAMRCWRYDDVTSPWVDHELTNTEVLDHVTDGDWWGHTLIERWSDDPAAVGYNEVSYNPCFGNGLFSPGVYFSCCTNEWDSARGKFYMFADGIYHDLATDVVGDTTQYNRWTFRLSKMPNRTFRIVRPNGSVLYPTKYVSCDPRQADTDEDGMDDFYELYHGLNPILGSRDIINEAWGGNQYPSAMANWWIDNAEVKHGTFTGNPADVRLKDKDKSLYDFYQFPWLAGLPDVDPDGDNIRNQQESILPKAQAAATYQHTDPTPLWMTDTSFKNSLTHRFYQVLNPSWAERVESFWHPTGTFSYKGVTHRFDEFPWMTYDAKTATVTVNHGLNRWNTVDTMFAYEENEGFDSDHDFVSDYEESQGKSKPTSDPQQHDDPLRHQAMWFGGAANPSFLQQPLMDDYYPPLAEAGSEFRQDFLYYTVEAWVKPDASIISQNKLFTAVERVIWTGPANAADENFLRKNFLIGVKNGRWYTKYDSTGTDAKQPFEITDGDTATTNWTHVVATYGPANDNESDSTVKMALRLYVNGKISGTTKYPAVQPEHGVNALLVGNPMDGTALGKVVWTSNKPLISIIVGASAATKRGICFDNAWESRAQTAGSTYPHIDETTQTTFDDYDSFFKGYIDEVRIWDGARKATDINSDYQKRVRYTAETAAANRQEVFAAWAQGARRAPTTPLALPAELRYHWSFDHLAGAVNASDVDPVPHGFATDAGIVDSKPIWSRPLKWTSTWYEGFKYLRSKVYKNFAWVPWINNTVSHLPCLDGTTADSVYWTEDYAGDTAAVDLALGFTTFGFPRTAEVWSRQVQQLYSNPDPYTQATRWNISDQKAEMRFTFRNRLVVGADLMPLGGAFPKRISSAEGGMWDDGCAADAWASTSDGGIGGDSDGDGLPNWWTEYARNNYAVGSSSDPISWDTTVRYFGVLMPAYQAYMRDLAKGMLSDTDYHSEFRDERDADGDGIPEWWENMYGINTHSTADALADPDNDGLSNYQEYLIAEKFLFFAVDPTKSRTFDAQVETDYFLKLDAAQAAKKPGAKVGMYLGEVFADHDFLEDNDEAALGTDPTKYDAYTDKDGDGWTAFAEQRYANFKLGIFARFVSHLNGEEEVKDAPVPVAHAMVRYLGESTGSEPLVVEAYAGNNLQKQPTARYTFTPGVAQTHTLNLGPLQDRKFHGTLAPGHIVAGPDLMKLQFFFVQSDDRFTWSIGGQMFTGTYEEMYKAYQGNPSEFVLASQAMGWNDIVNGPMTIAGVTQALQVSQDSDSQKGHFLLGGKRVGEIDFVTGDFDLDIRDFKNEYVVGNSGNTGTTATSSAIQFSQCFFRLEYQTRLPVQQTKALALSLATPDTGALTEGKTTFVAYLDKDGDGAFTPGVDPVGFVKDVEIGWDNVPSIEIEMTDASQAAGERFVIPAEASTIRIIRTQMNGQDKLGKTAVKRRIVYSRNAAEVARKNVFEADLVTGGKFGLDWANLRNDITTMGVSAKEVTSVSYVVVTNVGSVLNIPAADILASFTVDYSAEATKPVCVSPTIKSDDTVKTQRPTFVWTAADGYTAFRVEIGDATGSNWFYDSGLQVLPARNEASQFVWTAPVFVGSNVCNDVTILANNSNYLWRVAMYNAKFSNTNDAVSTWSDKAAFKTALAETNDRSTDYGSAEVTVRYYGPATNDLADVFVELYETADFTGTPAARTRLFNVTGKVDSLTNGAKVVFHGLKDGTYYALAFVDRNRNGVRENYETWGYSAQVGIGAAAMWTPTGVEADHANSKIGTIELFMEDTDLNRNGVIDIFDNEDILKSASETTTIGVDLSDTDGDGLTADDETGDTYTEKNRWDTDGDGLPDGWEAKFADTDPLMADADTTADGDLMAFAVTSGVYRLVANAAGMQYLVRDTNGTYRVGDTLTADKLITTYDYVTIVADASGTNFVKQTYAGLGTNLVSGADFQIDSIAVVDVALVHAQVYDEFGYSQDTAIDPANEHTKAFTALDKYMLARYLQAIGIQQANEEQMNLKKEWKDYTLKPGDKDHDRDGVADGWELYLMFGTNKVSSARNYATPAATPINPWKFSDRSDDIDGDTLKLVDEYSHGKMPTDPWDKISAYRELKAKGMLPDDTAEFTDDKVAHFGISKDEYEQDFDKDEVLNGDEIRAYYQDMAKLSDINPENPFSDGFTPDYFRRCGSTYIGLIYNGGEFIERDARIKLDLLARPANGTRDLFQSGWDVWSITRYSYAKAELAEAQGISEELSIANKYTYVLYGEQGYNGVSEADLVKFHQEELGHFSCTSLGSVISTHGGLDAMKAEIRARAADTLSADGFEVPEPTLTFTFKYTGNNQRAVVVDAWQTSSIYPEMGEQITASWATEPAFDSGIGKAEVKLASRGTLKQGKVRFVAYIDKNGDGMYTPGETWGTTIMNIGYSDASVNIRLGDANPALPYIDVAGREGDNRPIQTIGIVRTKVNGAAVTPRGVTLRRYENNVNRTVIYPSDYVSDDFIGVDSYLASETSDKDPTADELPNVETVTYEIVRIPANNASEGDDGWKISVSNLNHYTVVLRDANGDPVLDEDGNEMTVNVDQDVNDEFTLNYSITRDVPLEVKGEPSSKIDETIVSFTCPTNRAITKFWLKIDGEEKKGKNGRGYLLANYVSGNVLNDSKWLDESGQPYAAALGEYNTGRVILDGDWFKNNGITFTNGSHTIQVALGNDKFPEIPTEDTEWSAKATFVVGDADVRSGMILVKAVHPYEAASNFAGHVTIAAYALPDLANPVTTVVKTNTDAAVVLNGLRAGESYYLAAWYVRNLSDGRTDPTERRPYDTWGYLTSLGEIDHGFTPKGIKALTASIETNVIYMQDTDWNDNGVIDRKENFYAVIGETASKAPEWLDLDCDGVLDTDDEDPVFDNSKDALEYDVMAYATKRMFCVQIGTVDIKTNWVWYAVTDIANEACADKLDNGDIIIPRGTSAADITTLATTYLYGRKSTAPLGLGTNVTGVAGKVYDYAWKDIALVHAQVYSAYGFNPNTANALISSGEWVNTKKFTSLDKYIVTNYLAAIGAVVDPGAWTNWVLNAKRIDFDYDGIPDGWELYTMFGTNDVTTLEKTAKTSVINPWVDADRNLDPDGDQLTNLHEYNGGAEPTDPWNAYSMYENLVKAGLVLDGTEKFNDGIVKRFGVSIATANNDDDNDLISNLNEMLAYYRDPVACTNLSITSAWSDGTTPDYFRAGTNATLGSFYLGQLFNGAEFIEPDGREAMELLAKPMFGTRCYEQSGWSFWSTARYSILNIDKSASVEGVSEELMLIIRYINMIRPGELTGSTLTDVLDYFHKTWEGIVRAIDDDGNVVVEAKDASVRGGSYIADADACTTTEGMIRFFGGKDRMQREIAANRKRMTKADILAPEVAIDLLVKYMEHTPLTLTIEAYQTSMSAPELGEQNSATWSGMVANFANGIAAVKLSTPTKGALVEGPARFIAYVDANNDGKFSSGEIYGTTSGNIGYLGCELTIELGEPNVEAYPIIPLTSGSNTVSTIALVRSAINGQYLYNDAVGAFIVQFPNNAAREALCPEDYVMSGHVGIDKTLSKLDNRGNIETVTYEVLRLTADQVANLSVTNLNHYYNGSNYVDQAVNKEVTIHYSLQRDVASSIAVAGNTADDIKLSFTVPTDTANSRFWLSITNETTGADSVYGGTEGFVLTGMRDGVMVLDSDWLEDNEVPVTTGRVTFAVALGNDKYGKPATFTGTPTATTYVNAARTYDGEITVDVRHPLPGVSITNGLTIAAYDKADLANPVAFTNGNATGVVTLKGLRAGVDYYVAAWYVKDVKDGRADASERRPYDTWGYLCNLTVTNKIGVALSSAFDAVTAVAAKVASVTNRVYLQDTDWNNNGILDREEHFSSKNGTYATIAKPTYGLKINGLKSSLFSDADEGDVMAYALVSYTCVATTNELGEAVWYVIADLDKETTTNKTTVGIRKGTLLSELTTLYTTYWYDEGDGDPVQLGLGRKVAVEGDAKVTQAATKEILLVHAQVYSKYGFNSKTANGAIDETDWVHTKAFDSTDKAYVVNYLKNVVGVAEAEQFSLVDEKNNTYPDADYVVGGRGDGIIDGWELYVMFGPTGIVELTANDLTNGTAKIHSPWNYADRYSDLDGDRLDQLHEYNGGANPTDPWSGDSDGDGVLDYYAYAYNLNGGNAGKDDDGDGLSNYTEYLIREVFGFAKCDPPNQYATSVGVCDYYKKVGDLYLGEMFQDHDRVDDEWERQFAPAANMYVYDPSRDDDNDGWSNWAESKAGTNPGLTESPTVDSTLPEYPIPAIRAKVVYNGNRSLVAPLKFMAWSERRDPYMLGTPDAVWTASSSVAASNTVKYLGRNPGKQSSYYLGTGTVTPGSLKVYFRDMACEKVVLRNGSETSSIIGTDTSEWYYFIEDRAVAGQSGELYTVASTNSATANVNTNIKVGTIDYSTGLVTIDFTKLPTAVYDYYSNGVGVGDGTDKNQYVYYNAIKLDLSRCFVRLEWKSAKINTSGNATYYLSDCDGVSASCNGHIREGLNSFIVFSDTDNNGIYTAGEPMGYVKGVDVGWQGGEFSVELTEVSAISPRVSIWDSAVSDRSVIFSEYASTPLTDRTATKEQLKSLSNRVQQVSAEADASKARLRVVRFGVNGMYAYRAGVGFEVSNFVDRVYDAQGRGFLCEADFLNDGEFDIEWNTLWPQVINHSGTQSAFPEGVSNMTYLAVLDGGEGFQTWIRGADDTNTIIRALGTTIERRYEINQSKPVAESMGVVYGARPTFRWSLPNEEAYAKKYGTSYTAFRVFVTSADGNTLLWNSSIKRLPPADANGYFSWTADLSAGDLVSNFYSSEGVEFSYCGNYQWQVAMYNAKFPPKEDIWYDMRSEPVAFSVAVNAQQEMNDHTYSSIDAAVKYAGPATNLTWYADLSTLKGKVRVQAFATADFAGDPLSETVVTTNVENLASAIANVRLVGLPATGTYYLRAYIDSDGDHELDAWESWGAADDGVTLTTATLTAPVIGIWIEDSDVDQDWLPDAYEYIVNGGIAPSADVKSDSQTIFTTDMLNAAKDRLATFSTGLEGTSLTIFENGTWAAELLGWGDSSSTITFDDIRAAVQHELDVKADTFKITSLTLGTDGKVRLTVDAEVAPTVAGQLLSSVYGVTPGTKKTVKLNVYKKSTLMSADWGVPETFNVEIGAGEAEIIVDVGVTAMDLKSGFYKIDIVE